jgi:hypothetical protein
MIPREMEVDLGGIKDEVFVDGVAAIVSRLEPDDFVSPRGLGEHSQDHERWDPVEGQSGQTLYNEIYRLRSPYSGRGGLVGNVLSGEALAIQWNKDGRHYILIGKKKGPITLDVLVNMAKSVNSTPL